MPELPKERPEPYLTLNAFGHYVMSKDAHERRRILRDMKFPSLGKSSQYSAAQEAVIRYLGDPLRDVSDIRRTIDRLKSESPTSDHDIVRRRNCCAALECFLKSLQKLRFEGFTVTRACLSRHRVRAGGVVISCRPELLLRGTLRGRKVVGAIKIRLTKNPIFDHEAGALCATILHSQIGQGEAAADETADRRFCQIVDVFNGCQIHDAPKAVSRRREQVVATCQEIASLWPGIERSASRSGSF